MYIHIQRERERERERDVCVYVCTYIYIYIYIYIGAPHRDPGGGREPESRRERPAASGLREQHAAPHRHGAIMLYYVVLYYTMILIIHKSLSLSLYIYIYIHMYTPLLRCWRPSGTPARRTPPVGPWPCAHAPGVRESNVD